jgi:hypothetical protein
LAFVTSSSEANEPNTQEKTCTPDYLGLISLGMLLFAVAIVFLENPFLVSDFRLLIERITNEGILIRPPRGLITSAAIFFVLIGLSGFIKAATRLRIAKLSGRVFADVFAGLALVLFAYLITLYGSHLITWLLTLAIEAAACGILLVLYGIVRFVFFKEH